MVRGRDELGSLIGGGGGGGGGGGCSAYLSPFFPPLP